MHTTIPKRCVQLLEQMEANFRCGDAGALCADQDTFVYCKSHGYIKLVIQGTYFLTRKANLLLAEQRLHQWDQIDELLSPRMERRKHPTPKRTASPAITRPAIGTTDHVRSLVYTAAGWVDARSPMMLEAIDRLTVRKGAWLAGWECLGDDPRTQRRFDKIRKGERSEIAAHIEPARKGYRWVDKPFA